MVKILFENSCLNKECMVRRGYEGDDIMSSGMGVTNKN